MNKDVILIISLVVAVDIIVIGAIFASLRGLWSKIAGPNPGIDRGFGAEPGPLVWRMRIGVFKLGGMFRVAADQTHLHFVPSAGAAIFGLGPASVPLKSIEYLDTKRGLAVIRIERQKISLPASVVPDPPGEG